MGQIFARLFKEEGLGVVIAGPTKAKGEKIAEELGVEYTLDNVKAVKDADIVVVTVPMDRTIDVIKEVGAMDSKLIFEKWLDWLKKSV